MVFLKLHSETASSIAATATDAVYCVKQIWPPAPKDCIVFLKIFWNSCSLTVITETAVVAAYIKTDM